MPQQPKINFDGIPDAVDLSDIPDAHRPEGFLNTIADTYNQFIGEHPVIRRMIYGPNLEETGGLPIAGDYQPIPGIQKGAKWLADQIDPSNTPEANRGFLKPFAAGAIEGLGDFVASGADPRAVGLTSLIRSRIKPYIPRTGGPIVDAEIVQPQKLLGGETELPPLQKQIEGQIGEPKQLTTRIPEPEPPPGPNVGFYGGDQGLAVNRPHVIDIRPITPETLSNLPAEYPIDVNKFATQPSSVPFKPSNKPLKPTILPEELEGQLPIRNPMLPANYGLRGLPAYGQELTSEQLQQTRTSEAEKLPTRKLLPPASLPASSLGKVSGPLKAPQEPSEYRPLEGPPDRPEELEPYRAPTSKEGKPEYPGVPEFPPSIGPRQPLEIQKEPYHARSEQGGIKTGFNVKRGAQEVTSGYSAPLEQIMIREAFANAIDAVRDNPDAKIDVNYYKNPDGDNVVEVKDNGKGMNRQELETVFSDIHESGKVTQGSATGGKGIGKASFQRGGKYFWMQTTTKEGYKKVQYTLYGTPDDFDVHIPVNKVIVPDETPTGTIVRTTLKPGQKDPSVMIHRLRQFSRDLPGKLSGYFSNKGFRKTSDDKVVFNDNIAYLGADNGVTISIPKDESLKESNSTSIYVLNNGIYQYNDSVSFPKKSPNIPERVVINVKPTAEEGSDAYPFPTQRESLKTDISNRIEELVVNLIHAPEARSHESKLLELYNSIQDISVPNTARKPIFLDPGSRLTPVELAKFYNSPVTQNLIQIYDETIDDILHLLQVPGLPEKVEGVGITLDPGSHGIYIPHPTDNKSIIGFNPFARGHFDSLEDTITAMHEVAHVGTDIPTDLEPPHEHYDDPRYGEYLATYLKHIGPYTGGDVGHALGFAKRLGKIYATYGPGRFYDTIERLQDVYRRHDAEFQELLQIYKDSRGRPATTEDYLTPTGTKQGLGSSTEGIIPSDAQTNTTGTTSGQLGRVRGPLDIQSEPFFSPKSDKEPSSFARGHAQYVTDKLRAAIRNGKDIARAQAESYSQERSERISEAAKVKDLGRSGFHRQKQILAGEYEKIDYKTLQLNEDDVDALFKTIRKSHVVDEWEKISTQEGLSKLLTGSGPIQMSEMKLLGRVFGSGVENDLVNMYGGIGLINHPLPRLAIKTANVMKSLMSSMDFSAPFNQGLPLIYSKRYWQAISGMIRAGFDKDFFLGSQKSLEEAPLYEFLKGHGLYLAETPGTLYAKKLAALKKRYNNALKNADVDEMRELKEQNIAEMNNLEEAFSGSFAEKIPWVRGSEQAYVQFLNSVRYKVAEDLVMDAFDSGLDPMHNPDLMRGIVRYVNNATGRGSLGSLEKIGNELGLGFFSPRTVVSTASFFNPNNYIKGEPFVRKQYLKSLLAMATFGLAANGAAQLYNMFTGDQTFDKPNFNMLESDFMKVKSGNVRLNTISRFQSILTSAARFVRSWSKLEAPDEFGPLGYMERRPHEVIGRFARSKESPFLSFIHDLMAGQSFTGDPTTLKSMREESNQVYANAQKFGPQALLGNPDTGFFPFIPKMIRQRFTHMLLGDLIDVVKENPRLLWMGIPAMFGMPIQAYDTEKFQKKPFRLRP